MNTAITVTAGKKTFGGCTPYLSAAAPYPQGNRAHYEETVRGHGKSHFPIKLVLRA